MKTITLAIPFYNTSKYFLNAIKYAIDDDFVSEICVTDDRSTSDEWKKLNDIVSNLNNDKVKIYRNTENLKPFRSKYNAVFNSSNEWVYLLDSDNHMFEDSIELIKKIPDDDPSIVYSPQNLYCKNDNVEEYEVISDYDFKYDEIGLEEIKDLLFKKHKWGRWFINSGNYIVNKNSYLSALEKPFEDVSTEWIHADTAASFYFLLKSGIRFKVVKDLKHHHTLRPESTWNACGENSHKSVNFYHDKIINLYEDEIY